MLDPDDQDGAETIPDDVTELEEVKKDTRPAQTNGGELIFKHYKANGAAGRREAEDIEMQ